MSEQRVLLAHNTDRLFKELMTLGAGGADQGDLSSAWNRIEAFGLVDLFLPENLGGFDGCWADAQVVFALLGLHGLALPVGEAIIARKLLDEAKMSLPHGIITLAVGADAVLDNGADECVYFSGTLVNVPWGALAEHILLACTVDGLEYLVLLACDQAATIEKFQNEAFEPRDTLHFQRACVEACVAFPDVKERVFAQGAFLRTAQISGAIQAALSLTLGYINQREQFGRPLAKFQALQHQVALLAEEAAAVNCAAMAAALCADKGDATFEFAAAKLRANQAVGEASAIAHQAHGAIGFTREYPLHRWTQRMWSWRTEFGNDRHWSNKLGNLVLAEGAEHFWANLTSRSDK